MIRRAALLAAVAALAMLAPAGPLRASGPALPAVEQARAALIARVTPAVVEILAQDPAPPPEPPQKLMADRLAAEALSPRACRARGGVVDRDRKCVLPPRRIFPPQSIAQRLRSQRLGSGLVIDADQGLVLTAHHIVAGRSRVTVRLADGRRVVPVVVASDADTGLAVLKLAETGLTALPLSARAPVAGQASIVVARLAPLAMTAASGGMVAGRVPDNELRGSALLLADIWLLDNPLLSGGTGGGPVLDSAGTVIGIVQASIGGAQRAQDPVAMIALHDIGPTLAALVRDGRIARSAIGANLACERDWGGSGAWGGAQDGAATDDAKPPCQLTNVDPSGPAAAAGLVAGDRIAAIAGQPATSNTAVLAAIARAPVGATLSFRVRRDGVDRQFDVVTVSRD